MTSVALTTLSTASASSLSGADGTTAADGVYIYSLHATAGDLVELATRLSDKGYEVTGRDGETLWVQGNAATRTSLAAEGGLSIDGSQLLTNQAPETEPTASQDPILPKKLDGNHYDTFYGGYRTVDAFYKFEDDLAKAYPKLVQVVKYGNSYDGNALRAVCITADADKGCELKPGVDKARFLLMTQIHARELTTSEIAWRFMTATIDGYKKDAESKALLDSTELWVVPDVNPDGIKTVEQGITDEGTGQDSPAYQRKNRNLEDEPDGGCPPPWISSHPGIDLNRNWNSHYGGASTSSYPCSEVYKGTGPASEVEVSHLADLFTDLFRDQRGSGADDAAPLTTTGAMITLHTYANLTLLPWGYDRTIKAPNDAGLRSMGFRTSNYNHYTTGQAGEVLYNASGTTDDWAYDKLGIASFTWELGPGGGSCSGFLPAYTCQDDFWTVNKPALYYAAAAARQPYTLSLGPTTEKAKAKASGSDITVTATSNDDAYGTSGVGRPAAQKVTDARIYIGKSPWDGGTPQAMKIKGSGTSVSESITVDAPAKKTLGYVQGKDADGNWGPIAAVWLKPAK